MGVKHCKPRSIMPVDLKKQIGREICDKRHLNEFAKNIVRENARQDYIRTLLNDECMTKDSKQTSLETESDGTYP